jgi:hypothetical protein
MQLKFRTPAFSETCKTEVVCPNDTNPMGILQGGCLVQWIAVKPATAKEKEEYKTALRRKKSKGNN